MGSTGPRLGLTILNTDGSSDVAADIQLPLCSVIHLELWSAEQSFFSQRVQVSSLYIHRQ